MSNQDNHTDDSLTDGAGTTSAGGDTAVDSSTLSLTELNKFLGKDFKDKDSALKALRDTQAFVGKRVEDIAAQVRSELEVQSSASQQRDNSLESQVQSLTEQVFFANNPQYKGYESIIKKMGDNPAEVVASEEFKTIFEKARVADEVAKQRTVVSSASRVAQATSATDDAIKVANATKSTSLTAEALARAIISEATEGQQ